MKHELKLNAESNSRLQGHIPTGLHPGDPSPVSGRATTGHPVLDAGDTGSSGTCLCANGLPAPLPHTHAYATIPALSQWTQAQPPHPAHSAPAVQCPPRQPGLGQDGKVGSIHADRGQQARRGRGAGGRKNGGGGPWHALEFGQRQMLAALGPRHRLLQPGKHGAVGPSGSGYMSQPSTPEGWASRPSRVDSLQPSSLTGDVQWIRREWSGVVSPRGTPGLSSMARCYTSPPFTAFAAFAAFAALNQCRPLDRRPLHVRHF